MKKISVKQLMIISVAGLLLALTACTKDFDKINDNPNSPKNVPTSYLLAGAEKGLMDNTWDRWWNGSVGMLLAQYYSENLYTDESLYKFRTEVTKDYWTAFYAGGASSLSQGNITYDGGGLKELQTILDLCNSAPALNSVSGYVGNQKAVATLLQVWTYQNMTDTWGDIPFSEALQDVRNTQPKYDKQRDIYLGMLSMIDSANKWMDVTKADLQGDLIYSGNMAAWQKFSNSLKLRVAIRMADKEPTIASTRITEAVNGAGGVFSSNTDNAVFNYLSGSPNYNPLYYDRQISGRLDFSSSSTMVDTLNSLADIRVGYFYDTANGGAYIGRPYGQNGSNAGAMALGNVSQPSQMTVNNPTAPGVYLDYAQVEFMLAEAVERGIAVGGTADQHYKNGINASFQFWTGTSAPSSYMTQAGVDYATLKGAGKTWKQIIGFQKWIALYMQGIQGWIEYRRLDFGVLRATADPQLEGTGVPVRIKYPFSEATLNTNGYNQAITNQGPDLLTTKVWWDMY